MTDTDALILRLSQDAAAGPAMQRTVTRAFLPALLAALAALLLGWGLREGLVPALGDPAVPLKIALPSLACAAGVSGALALSRPEGEARGAWAVLGLVAAAGVVLVAVTLARLPAEAWGDAVRGRTLVACLLSIPSLAAVPVAALLLALRRGASTAPGRSGLLAGLGGGAGAAALYALHCPEDNPLFFVTWYGSAVLLTGLLGAVLGRRMLRW